MLLLLFQPVLTEFSQAGQSDSQPKVSYYRPDQNYDWGWVGPRPQLESSPIAGQMTFRSFTQIGAPGYRIVRTPNRAVDTVSVVPPQTFPVPSISQPETARFTPIINYQRYIVDAPRRFDGATVQQTYVFAPYQPGLSRFSEAQRNRFIVEVTKRFESAAVASSQMFFRSFTQVGRPGYRIVQGPKTAAIENIVPPQQTYIFDHNQPDERWSLDTQRLRFVVDEPKYFEGVLQPPTVSVFLDKVYVGTIFGGWIDSIDPRAGGL